MAARAPAPFLNPGQMHPMSDIDVSVIIPFWKRPDFLFEGIESILAQTYTGKVEIIVVDDGSPEDISVSLPQRFPTVPGETEFIPLPARRP